MYFWWDQSKWHGGGGKKKKRSFCPCPNPDCNSWVFTDRIDRQPQCKKCATLFVRKTETAEKAKAPPAASQAVAVPETARTYFKTLLNQDTMEAKIAKEALKLQYPSIEKEPTVQTPSQQYAEASGRVQKALRYRDHQLDLLLKLQQQVEEVQSKLDTACAEYTASNTHFAEIQQKLRLQQGETPEPPPFVSTTSMAILEKGAESPEEKAAFVQMQDEVTAANKHFLEYQKRMEDKERARGAAASPVPAGGAAPPAAPARPLGTAPGAAETTTAVGGAMAVDATPPVDDRERAERRRRTLDASVARAKAIKTSGPEKPGG